MTDDPRFPQLLDELLASHGMPEEICKFCPELLPEVRKRWRRIRRLCADLDTLFPPPDDATQQSEPTELPQVPGYKVEGVLGRGGMGIVFRARHLGLNRPVALKMALWGKYAEPRERTRFQREAEAAAGLRHPNIVQVYDVGEVDDLPYFTMEYINGQTLAQKLAATPQQVQQAALLATTLADAVQTANACGIVHRDLKPANILLTADGTPKITDFGLARRVADTADLTQSGVAVGTPSYMAPEQARGHAHAIGPGVDVYSLGAILYEMLTGRPPFRGETPAETVLQVLLQEPVPPSKLNARVPQNLETICLKCLNKEPSRRYGTAVELAADLLRFRRGEPVLARRVGPVERLVMWTWRHRSLSAFITSSFLLLTVLLTGATWRLVERTVLAREVEDDFQQVVKAQNDQKWGEARTALERAKARLGSGGPLVLLKRAAQLDRELKLVGTLEEIFLSHIDTNSPDVLYGSTAVRYEEALSEAGLANGMEDPAVVAARIRATGIALPVLAALDDWAHDWLYDGVLPDTSRQDWLLEVARLVDENPASWPIRDAKLWENKAALEEFARSAQLSNQSVPLLTFLAKKLHQHGGDGLALLKHVQQTHVNSFEANVTLADSLLLNGKPAESLRYYQAAIALRPNHAALHHNIGKALGDLGQREEALVELREASRLAPNSAFYSTTIGRTLINLNRLAEAEQQFRKVLETNPNYAYCLTGLGYALYYQRRYAEAIEVYNRAITLDPDSSPGSKSKTSISKNREVWPDYAEPYRQLKESYSVLRRWEEARNAWKQWLSFNTPNHQDWDGYAELCLYLGNESEYKRTRTELLKRFSKTTDPRIAERTGRTCLFLPTTDEELKQATALIDRALAVEKPDPVWIKPYFLFAKALAEYRGGRLKNSLELLQGDTLRILPPAPGLLLAMVQHRLGQAETARKTFCAAIASYNWDPANVNNRESWMNHLLRREAEVVLASKP